MDVGNCPSIFSCARHFVSKSERNMNETFGFLTICGDNKVDVVSTTMVIEVSSSRENEYVSELPSLFRSVSC
jgi:hypothetical protein